MSDAHESNLIQCVLLVCDFAANIGQVIFGHRELLFIRKNFDKERRFNNVGRWFDDV